MADYQKVTPAKFRARLKDDQYASLTGARRAIGRMSEWSDGQKARARKDAEAYFPEEGSAPPKKAGKKSVAKKKTAKKVAKKIVAKKAKAKSKKAAAKAKPKGGALARQQARNKRKKSPSAPAVDSVQQANMKVGTITQALESMRVAKELGAGDTEVAQGAKKAQQALTSIVEDLCGAAAQAPLSEADQAEVEKLAVAASTGANGAGSAAQSSPGLAPPAPPSVPQVPADV
jgi:hypothetical protein